MAVKKVTEEVGKIEEKIEAKITEIDATIDQWFIDHFHGVAEMTTNVFNIAHEAKERLKQILKGA